MRFSRTERVTPFPRFKPVALVAAVTSAALLLSSCSSVSRPDEDYQLSIGILGDPAGYPASYEEAAIRLAVDEVNRADQGVQLSLVQADEFVPPEPEGDQSDDPDAPELTEEPPVETEEETGEEPAPTDEPTEEPVEPQLPESEITSLLSKGVQVILAPHTLAITENMVKEVIAADVPLISTAIADPESYNWVTQGLYLNAAPTSRLLGQALAQKLTIDGQEFIGMIRVNDFYTTLIKEGVEADLVPTTGQIVVDAPYAPDTIVYNSAVDLVLNQKPPVLTVLATAETPSVVNVILRAGYPAAQLAFVGLNALDWSEEIATPLTGALAISPSFAVDETFKQKLDDYLITLAEQLPAPAEGEEAPNLQLDSSQEALSAAARAYDNVQLLALASLVAGGVDATGLSNQLRAVSGGSGVGKEPVSVSSYVDGARELYAGQNINFEGVSGGIAYDRSGEPQQAIFTIYHYDEGNHLVEPEVFAVPNEAYLALLPEPLNAEE